MSIRIALALAFAALSAAFGAAPAQADTKLNVVGFGGANNLQTWVAQDRGFFQREGLTVDFSPTRGSLRETRDLLSGKYQIMTSAFDNIVADIEGQGEASIAGASDLVAFMGVSSGLENLVSRPEISIIPALRRRTVAVDARKSGYALLMYRLLQERNLRPDVDYAIIAVGGTPARVQALTKDAAQAAMLAEPVDSQLAKRGYHILAQGDEVGPYQGSVYVTSRHWANSHRSELSAYIRAIVAATDYIYADKSGAIGVLKQHDPRLSEAELETSYAELTGSGGFNRRAAINMAGVATVLSLRQQFGEPKRKLEPASAYVDTTYYRDAVAAK
jgi:ABC-type nitrate/sulfonate/bicarbonate transport system substrate-binding protein